MNQPRQHPGRHSADPEPEAVGPLDAPAPGPFEEEQPAAFEPAPAAPATSATEEEQPVGPPAPAEPVKPGLKPVQRTRTSGLWIAATGAAVVLILLLVFILQNNRSVRISYLGFNGDLPLGVALLLSAALGVLLVAIPGYGRILQLRRAAKRQAAARRKALAPPEEEKHHRRGLRR